MMWYNRLVQSTNPPTPRVQLVHMLLYYIKTENGCQFKKAFFQINFEAIDPELLADWLKKKLSTEPIE